MIYLIAVSLSGTGGALNCFDLRFKISTMHYVEPVWSVKDV